MVSSNLVFASDEIAVSEEVLSSYYKEYFPLDPFIEWLGYRNDETLSRREFSFTLKDDVYTRFRSFTSKEELHQAFIKTKPEKIDIGAIYNYSCKHRLSPDFKEEQRELVFDIDISDYDDVRTCCQEARICQKCWPLMSICVKVLEETLKTAFGFEQILFVFSGRRGIHCWVFDEEARKLNGAERFALAHYCQVTAQQIGTSHRLHTHIQNALKITDLYWDEYLETQDLLGTEEGIDSFLKYVKLDDSIKNEWKEQMLKYDTTMERWSIFQQKRKEAQSKKYRDRLFIERIKIAVTYPRIDIKVTEGFNHLLKAPFSVHPKTGKVCVPFNADDVDSFDCDNVPTVFSLRKNDEELVKVIEKQEGDMSKKYYHGEMKESVKIFTDLLNQVFSE
ncbi:unnamed protein product [Oikopleura dioica]|uniref:DNA primase n=1 Tax=Oikopleura dioica TaxID=34765 RepID=E4X2M8_OIKDI|nr:unnamed protein product [Oikopleura dioica]